MLSRIFMPMPNGICRPDQGLHLPERPRSLYRCDECEPIGHIVSDDGLAVTVFMQCQCFTLEDGHGGLPVRR